MMEQKRPLHGLFSFMNKELAALAFLCAILLALIIVRVVQRSAPDSNAIRVVSLDTRLRHSIDINTATEAQLTLVPGIGQARARRIVAHRNTLPDGFQSIEELAEIEGINRKLVEQIEVYISASRN